VATSADELAEAPGVAPSTTSAYSRAHQCRTGGPQARFRMPEAWWALGDLVIKWLLTDQVHERLASCVRGNSARCWGGKLHYVESLRLQKLYTQSLTDRTYQRVFTPWHEMSV